MKPIGFLPEAEQEMLKAVRYYESQASGLGADYLSEIERAVASIAESQMTWSKVEGELRRASYGDFLSAFYTVLNPTRRLLL